MSDIRGELFFQKQIADKILQIVASIPPDMYPPARKISTKTIFVAYKEEVQYFVVEDPFYHPQEEEIIKNAVKVIGKAVKYIKQSAKSDERLNFFINLKQDKEQAVVRLTAFSVVGNEIFKQTDWKSALEPKDVSLLQGILQFATKSQFSGQTIKGILWTPKERKILLQIKEFQFLVDIPVQDLTTHQLIIKYIQIALLEIIQGPFLVQPQSFYHCDQKISLKGDLVSYINNFSWSKRVKLAYTLHFSFNLVIYQGALSKAKDCLYINSISALIAEVMNSTSTLPAPISKIIHSIIEESQQPVIIDLFSQLNKRLSD